MAELVVANLVRHLDVAQRPRLVLCELPSRVLPADLLVDLLPYHAQAVAPRLSGALADPGLRSCAFPSLSPPPVSEDIRRREPLYRYQPKPSKMLVLLQ